MRKILDMQTWLTITYATKIQNYRNYIKLQICVCDKQMTSVNITTFKYIFWRKLFIYFLQWPNQDYFCLFFFVHWNVVSYFLLLLNYVSIITNKHFEKDLPAACLSQETIVKATFVQRQKTSVITYFIYQTWPNW